MRETEQLSGCLLQSDISYPQKKALLCGHCPNRSDDVGDLGVTCKATPAKKEDV